MDDIVITGSRFQELEATIEQGKQTFVSVGLALLEIRDSRAYRLAGWDTFEAYCQERWGWTRQHAYQLIDAAGVVVNLLDDNLSNQFDNQPSATQALQLAPLPTRTAASCCRGGGLHRDHRAAFDAVRSRR